MRPVLAFGKFDAAGRGEISASSMVLIPFWTTVTRAFLTTLPSLDDRLVKRDVVGLPLERRLAGVHRRDDLLVDRAAVVVLGLEPVGVEDLELVDARPGRRRCCPAPCPRALGM